MDFFSEKEFLEFIYQKTGIHLQNHQLSTFREQVLIACKKFSYPSATAYLAALQTENNPEESDFLISAITVGETYFFRYPEQIDFLTQSWLVKQLEYKKNTFNKSLCIWSTGCSTGEEIYSLAILLDQHIPNIEHWSIKLFGTDINKFALEQASKGLYEARALRNVPDAIKEHYFDELNNQYRLKPFILKRVNFSCFNLNSPTLPLFYNKAISLDLIICNNVFIYFNEAIIKKIMLNFGRLLNTNGCLLLAPADITLAHKLAGGLSLKRHKMLSYFQSLIPEKNNLSLKTSAKIETLIPLPKNIKVSRPQKLESINKTINTFISEIKAAQKKGNCQLVLKLANEALSIYPKQVDFWQYKAQVLAHLGKIIEALQASTEAVKQESLSAYPFYFHAMLQLDNNNLSIALQFFRKALFLNWYFPECHFHLAQLLVRTKDKEKALKHFESALEMAKKYDSEKSLENEPEITYAKFIDILEYEILTIN